MSNLEDLYREIILDHYRNPRNRGELVTPPAVKGKSLEEVRATINTFKQLMTVHEATLDNEAEPEPVNLRALGELAALQGVVKFPVRIKCATLSWNTLTQGLDEL